jgi:PAS domain S-box-containing protein
MKDYFTDFQRNLIEVSDFKYALEESCILVLTDGKGTVLYVNDNFCKISKYNREELVGNDLRIINSGYHSKAFINDLWSKITDGKTWRGELRNKSKDGAIFWLNTTIVPFLNKEGKPYQYIAINVDVTGWRMEEEVSAKIYREKEAILNSISESVVSVDNEWRYTFLNDAALSTHFKSRKEIVGKVIWDIHPEMEGTIFWVKYHEAMQTRKEIEIESYYLPMDTWFFVKVYPSADGLTIFYKDITENKKAEEKLLLEKNLSQSIVNSLPGIFYLYDQNGTFIQWNKNFETISGYTSYEISIMNPLDFFGPDEKELLRDKIKSVFENGKAEVEAHFLTKNNVRIPFFFNGHKTTINGEDYLLGVGFDITERNKIENSLKESEEKYRYLFNNNPALIFIWDIETLGILEVNDIALELYGYTRKEFLDMTVLDYRPEEDHASIREFITNARFNSRKTWRHLKKNGQLMYMDIASHLIDYHGRKAILSLAKDITDQVAAENQLKETYNNIRKLNAHLQTIREEERTVIAREIHDELGQQLTGLKMDASWLMKKMVIDDKSQQEKLADMIALIDDSIKTVRRISSDLRPGILDDLGLVAALEWQSNEFEKRTGLHCSFQSKLEDFQLKRDLATGIFRIYQEALTNVMRHSNAAEVITILEQKDQHIVLTIQDFGDGFDLSEVKNKQSLGLTGMQERALMFSGHLKIESKKGHGTKIILEIPFISPESNT